MPVSGLSFVKIQLKRFSGKIPSAHQYRRQQIGYQ